VNLAPMAFLAGGVADDPWGGDEGSLALAKDAATATARLEIRRRIEAEARRIVAGPFAQSHGDESVASLLHGMRSLAVLDAPPQSSEDAPPFIGEPSLHSLGGFVCLVPLKLTAASVLSLLCSRGIGGGCPFFADCPHAGLGRFGGPPEGGVDIAGH